MTRETMTPLFQHQEPELRISLLTFLEPTKIRIPVKRITCPQHTAPHQMIQLPMRPTPISCNSIALLIDSNGKYIDLDRFSPKSPTHKYFTPTITSAIETLKSNDLRKPTHIIIHTGTNDLDRSTVSQCIYKYQEMVKLVSDKHPSSKIIIS